MSIGIVGYTKDNGHPYSFSSIINGFDPSSYPDKWQLINSYLSRKPSEEFISGYQVTHIYCEDKQESVLISKASLIPNICDSFHELLVCDFIFILSDYSSYRQLIVDFFLERGKYLFVDKPVASTLSELDKYSPYIRSGQLHSSSSLCHAYELDNCTDALITSPILVATAPSNLLHYGIHALQPLLFKLRSNIVNFTHIPSDKLLSFSYELDSGQIIVLSCGELHPSKIQMPIQIISNLNSVPQVIRLSDNFTAFKRHILKFLSNHNSYPFDESYCNAVEFLIKSKSLLN